MLTLTCGHCSAVFCDDASMTRPLPVEIEDEIARLQREVVKAAELFKQTVDKLERLSK